MLTLTQQYYSNTEAMVNIYWLNKYACPERPTP